LFLVKKRYERAFTIEDVKVVTFTKGIVDECDVFGQHYTVRWFEEGKTIGVGVDEFTEVFIKVHFEDIGYDTEWPWKNDIIQFTMEDIYGDSIEGRWGHWIDFTPDEFAFEETYPTYDYSGGMSWKGVRPHAVISVRYKPDIWRALTLEYIPCDEDRTISIKLIG
jgi:hypothetical protein